jgi:CoA:oxalate CoA-transferase
MGKSELKEDPRFNNLSQRVKNMDLVDGMVEEWTKDKTTAEVLTQLEAAHIPCAPVATIDKVINDPQLKERKMILDINQDEVKLTLPASVFKLSQTPGRITSLAPRLGEHTEEILTHFLNYSTVEIQQLREEGII